MGCSLASLWRSPTLAPVIAVVSAPPPPPPPVLCASCETEIPHDHPNIRCEGADVHHFCDGCSAHWIEQSLIPSLGSAAFPPLCSWCHSPIDILLIRRNIADVHHLDLFDRHCVRFASVLTPSQRWLDCPSCPYCYLWDSEDEPRFVHCQRLGCEKVTCYECQEEVSVDALERYREGFVDEEEVIPIRRHVEDCQVYAPMRRRVEELIRRGTMSRCPECGLQGRKDLNCTHISCECGTLWCYVCEKAEVHVEKDAQSAVDGSLGGHNVQWESMPETRCPMYLHHVRRAFPHWPEDPQEALDYYHWKKTLRLLKAFLDDVPVARLDRLLELYPQVFGGFGLEQVRIVDLEKSFYEEDVPPKSSWCNLM